jgi:Spx/MgsR family transcriptional regulator
MTITLFGIKNCDTVKKARTWLDGKRIAYMFHDYKTDGIDKAHVAAWCKTFGWEKVLNKAGTTFRGLPASDQKDLDEAKAVRLMVAYPTLIKRPVLVKNKDAKAVGFKPEAYAEIFAR